MGISKHQNRNCSWAVPTIVFLHNLTLINSIETYITLTRYITFCSDTDLTCPQVLTTPVVKKSNSLKARRDLKYCIVVGGNIPSSNIGITNNSSNCSSGLEAQDINANEVHV